MLALSAPIMGALTSGLDRRSALLTALTVFFIGNVVTALATGYAVVMAARVVIGDRPGPVARHSDRTRRLHITLWAVAGIGLIAAPGIAGRPAKGDSARRFAARAPAPHQAGLRTRPAGGHRLGLPGRLRPALEGGTWDRMATRGGQWFLTMRMRSLSKGRLVRNPL